MPEKSPLTDRSEIDQFNALARTWWDPKGPMRPLHVLNPTRLNYIQETVSLSGRTVLDVGCGGGLLSEALAQAGARVTAVDMAEDLIAAAQAHSQAAQLDITYIAGDAGNVFSESGQQFEVVTCMEMIEHVDDPQRLLHTLSQVCAPGGHVFLSTLNRHPLAFFKAILGAEYVLNLLPRGTHHYEKFIKPSELNTLARVAGITLDDFKGIEYNPFNHTSRLNDSLKVNYIVHGIKA